VSVLTLRLQQLPRDHLLLADNDIVEQTFKLRRHPRINQGRVGLFENPESDKPASVGTMCFPWAIRKPCFFSAPMITLGLPACQCH
jgi:hypothetical protein